MPLIRRSAVVASAALLVALTTPAILPRTRDASRDVAETARIHSHFDGVLSELQSRDSADMPSNRRARRTRLVSALREYDLRGDFPHNYDFPHQPTPYFVDRKTGVRCAVAYLLESTGRHDIVRRVAAANNNVRVAQLSGDTAFTAWLDEQGLTLSEAARIQPSYEGSRGGGGVSTGAIVAVVGGSLLAVGSAVGTSIWNVSGNADGHNRFGNVLGVTSGVLTTIVGASIAGSREDNAARRGGVATAAVGGVSVALGLRGFARRSRTMAERREAERSRGSDRDELHASIVPIIGVGRNATAGLSMQIRF